MGYSETIGKGNRAERARYEEHQKVKTAYSALEEKGKRVKGVRRAYDEMPGYMPELSIQSLSIDSASYGDADGSSEIFEHDNERIGHRYIYRVASALHVEVLREISKRGKAENGKIVEIVREA